MIVRCTKKVLDLLGAKPASIEPTEQVFEWYVNLLWIDKRKNVLIVEAETLFAIFVADVQARHRPVRTLRCRSSA